MTEEELGLETRTPSEEPVRVEGIQTRKKKEKKAKPVKAPKTAVSTPVESRTSTPAPAEKVPSPEIVPVEEEKPAPVIEPVEVTAPAEPPKPPATAASIIAKLQAEGAITHETLENMFKSFPQGPNERQITLQDVPNRDRQYTLSDDAIKAVLSKREAFRLGGEDGRISSRVLVTPEGTILRGLSRDEEDRYLELEAGLKKSTGQPTRWNPTRDPVFDLDRIVRNLNVKAVVEKSNTLRQTQAALQKAAAAAAAAAAATATQQNHHHHHATNGGAAAAAAAAGRVYDEAANYNDEFIMPASPASTAAAAATTTTLLPPSIDDIAAAAADNSKIPALLHHHDSTTTATTRSSASTATAASTSSSSSSSSLVVAPPPPPPAPAPHHHHHHHHHASSSSSLLAAPFESHYIHVNGITLSDAAAPVLGIDLLGRSHHAGGKGGKVVVLPPPAPPASSPGAGLLMLQEVERELNAEKQRANECTKKLNAAVKRNRKVVGAAAH